MQAASHVPCREGLRKRAPDSNSLAANCLKLIVFAALAPALDASARGMNCTVQFEPVFCSGTGPALAPSGGVNCKVRPVHVCNWTDDGRQFEFRRPEGGWGGGINGKDRFGGEEASSGIESCADGDGEEAVTSAPVLIASGEKILPESDFGADGLVPLVLTRTYHSASARAGAFGSRWSSSLDYGLIFKHGTAQCEANIYGATSCNTSPVGLTSLSAKRPGGGVVAFVKQSNGDWTNTSNGWSIVVSPSAGGQWLYWQEDGLTEVYNSGGQIIESRVESGSGLDFVYTTGKLTSVVQTSGRSIGIVWSGNRISSVVAPGNKSFSYTYTPSGYLQAVTYPDGLGVRSYHYEVSGKPWLLTGVSVDGVRNTRYSYYADGRVQESGYEDGRETSAFTYAADRTTVTNALGQSRTYHKDPSGRVIRVDRPATSTCPAGATSSEYDEDGRVVAEVDGAGNRTTYVYTALGRLAEKRIGISPTGGTSQQQITRYEWDESGLLLQSVKEYGATTATFIRETAYAYYPLGDAYGRDRLLKTVTFHDRTSVAAPSRSSTYDYRFRANGEYLKVWVDGPLAGTSDRTTYDYGALGDLAKVTNGLGHAVTFGLYTSLGQPGRVIDANGLITDFAYDALRRMTRRTVKAPGGDRVSEFRYDPHGNLLELEDSSGRVTDYDVNGAGHETVVREPSAHPDPMTQDAKDTRTFFHNDLNQLVGRFTQKVWLKRVLTGWVGGEPVYEWVTQFKEFGADTWAYDAGGFLSNAFGNNGQNIRFNYNASGKLSKVTDSLNRATSTWYDTHGRIKTVQSPNGGSATFAYSPLGWLSKVTDREGRVTLYEYNGFGDVVRIISADSGTTEFGYDAAGRLETIVRADGSAVTITRDGLGRVLTESATWPTGSGQGGAKVHSYVYDTCAGGKGRLCATSDPTGSTSYAYLSSGELASQTSVIDGATFALDFTYDALGRLSTATYPNGVILRYGYTSAHKVRQIEAFVGGAWQYVIRNAAWQPFDGPPIGFTYGNNRLRDYTHDLDGRVTEIDTGISTLAYGYNANDLITSITNTNSVASQNYGYDTMGALTSASSTATGAHAWVYDDNGNRTSHAWGGSTDHYGLETGTNRLATLTGARPRSLVHDANGNLATETRGGITVTRKYDGFARLEQLVRPTAQSLAQPDGTTASLPAGTWKYGYNALGQRVSKFRSGFNHRHRALYSPGSLLLGQTNTNSTNLDTIYVWLGREPVGLIRNGQVYAIHADHIGRPEAVTNSAQATVWRANNYAFDRKVTTDTVGGLDIGFPGQTYDAEAGTWYNVFRDYDASTGRYVQADPTGLAGGINIYLYANADPTGSIDPLGLGPVAFGVCTAANIAYQAYSYHQSMKVQGSDELMKRLDEVNKKIEACGLNDQESYEDLVAERDEIGQQIFDASRKHAQDNSFHTMSDIGTSLLLWEAGCGLLLLAPIP